MLPSFKLHLFLCIFEIPMKYLLIVLLFPIRLFSQDITGLWNGHIYNDSTQKTLYYEVAIGESNGKYTAYSYTTFLVDNQESCVGVKSVKVVKSGDHFFFEDVDLLYNNYPVAPPKGVKQISSLRFNEVGNERGLNGKFVTTRSKQYGRQVTGTVTLLQSKKASDSKLLAMLEGLHLSHTLSFVSPKKDTVSIARSTRGIRPSARHLTKEKTKPATAIVLVPTKPVNPLEEVEKREINTIETVFFSSDSLRLILYDNGYVDGDSVSIIMNGKILLEHQRLSQQAITKTITPHSDSVQLIMYAENLGSIAPNTGLLIICDGEKRHEIRFEGDLQKNAAVILKREAKLLR